MLRLLIARNPFYRYQPWLLLMGLIVATVVGNLLLFLPAPSQVQSWAALGVAIVIPGLLLMRLLIGNRVDAPLLGERFTYGVGLGFVLMVLLSLGLSYLPGGLAFAQLLLAFDAIIVLLTFAYWRQIRTAPLPSPSVPAPLASWSMVALLILMAGAAYLRFTNIGYSELHGDEALVALRAVDVLQGWERALFVHKKGPGEILTAVVFYLLTGELSEYTAHLPFAFASWSGVLVTYLLGRRWFGPVAGWWAGAMVAVDGYLMAFGRMLQYQSVIFLLTVLTILVVQRAVDRHRTAGHYLLVAALLAATGLLYHYEAVIALIPALWLLYCLWQVLHGSTKTKMGQFVRLILVPLVVGISTVALFYVPFLLDPEFFRDTYYYIVGYRLAGHTVPDGLAVIAGRSTLYSSTYYFWTLVALIAAGLLATYHRYLRRTLATVLTILLIGVSAAMVLFPVAFVDLPFRLAPLLVAALFSPAWFTPRLDPSKRAAWLWFGITLIGVLFFVRKPGTHVYIFFVPWALVSGMVVGQGWTAVAERWGERTVRIFLAPLLLLLVVIFGNYVRQLFVANDVEVLRTWDENRPAGYWTSYESPAFESIFGFPIRNGWKTVATLYDQGVLQGRFDTNDRFSMVPDWYLRGEEYCARDAGKYYLLVPYPLPVDRPIVDEQRRALDDRYLLWGTITANDAPHMEIYVRQDETALQGPGMPYTLRSEEYIAYYNKELTAPFTRNGPLGAQTIPNPTAIRFGEHITLIGYQVDRQMVEAGGEVEVELYWETQAHLDTDYYVSIQIIDLSDAAKAGQRDGEPGCNRFPTTTWVPGDRIYDRYHVPINDDAQPGSYSIYVTMYSVDGNGAQQVLPATLPDRTNAGGAVLGEVGVESSK